MTGHADFDDTDYSFLKGGLLHRLLLKAGFSPLGKDEIRLRIVCVTFLTYIPLLLLASLQGVAWNPAVKEPFLYDLKEICRFIFVAPLLIVGEAIVEPWLVQVVRHIRERLIAKEDTLRFEQLIARAARFRDSNIAEILLLMSTFGWQFVEGYVVPVTPVTTWHKLPGSDTLTYAFFWYVFFAKPLIRFLWLRWLWRYLIWSVFLWRLVAIRLKILPTHPDLSGGLSFIAVGHARFAVLAFAFGLQAASMVGEQILFEGKTLMSFEYAIGAVVALVLAIFLLPLLAFTGRLLEAKRIGIFEYDALASSYITEFHTKWIEKPVASPDLLGTSDIQSLADLGNAYQVVRQMKMSLMGKEIFLVFLTATLLPFSPLILTVYPFDILVRDLLKAIM